MTHTHGRFSGLAEAYDRYRPSYPVAAIEAVVAGLPRPLRAVDAGCGTGISTRALAAWCDHVIGIDPNADMLAQARRAEPAAAPGPGAFRLAAAEATGLPDESADLVHCAQSFHWFDERAALREFFRILRPGGRLAILFNERETTDPASAEYERIVSRAVAHAAAGGLIVPRERRFDPAAGALFTNVRRLSFPNPQRFERADLRGRARSASYWPRDDARRAELERDLDALFDRMAVEGFLTLRQQTLLTLADRSA
jgi:ubiquinone/menaquinone biosynthesis C-methylase UbiE